MAPTRKKNPTPEELTRKCLKTYDTVHFRKFFKTLAKHAFSRGKTLIFGRLNIPYCKAFSGPKGHPLLRQNVKCGPFCKAKFSRTHPLKWHTHSIPSIGRCCSLLQFEVKRPVLISLITAVASHPKTKKAFYYKLDIKF